MLIAVLAVCLAPIIASFAVYHFWPPDRRMNYGELIQPHPIADLPLRRLDGSSFRIAELRGRWIMIQIDAASCGESCRQKLYYMRQVRLAQGKGMDRVERLWLVTDEAPVNEELGRSYEGTRIVRVGVASALAAFPGEGAARENIFLVDPLGNLMLRFPLDPDPSRMKKDLDRLLKVSQVG